MIILGGGKQSLDNVGNKARQMGYTESVLRVYLKARKHFVLSTRRQCVKKVYVSSHDLLAGKGLANIIRAAGHKVVSTWHDDPWVGDLVSKADGNCRLIRKCDVLVVQGGSLVVTGGKWFEAGFALALNKDVIVVGQRGNILAHHPDITEVAADASDLIEALE